MSPLSACTLDPAHLTSAQVGAWQQLAANATEPNPFLEPAFLRPAARYLEGGRVRLVVVSDGADWIALHAVQTTLRGRRMPGHVRAAWRHPYMYLGTPLIARNREREAASALLAELRPGAGLVALELLDEDGPVTAALAEAAGELGLRQTVWERHERASLVRRPENDYVETTVKVKRRREMRRLRGQLEKELGSELVTVDRAGDPAAVERFLELEASGWKGRAGTALATANDDRFFREACAGFAAEGRLQLLALGTASNTVAMKCNLLSGDAVFCLKIAYDEELAKFSPGVQLELDNVGAFHDRTELVRMDSCADPDNQMINRLWPDRRRLVTSLWARGGVLGLVSRNQAELAANVRRRIKERAA